jgi:PKD repeat protein
MKFRLSVIAIAVCMLLLIGIAGASLPSTVKLYIPANSTVNDFSVTNNTVQAAGSAGINTTVYKYGGGSVSIGSANGYLVLTPKSDLDFLHATGTAGNWSIRTWYKCNSFSATQTLYDSAGGSSANTGISVYITSSRTVSLGIYRGSSGNSVISGSTSGTLPNDNNWHELVITYDQSLASNNAKFYADGSPIGTLSKSAYTPSTSTATYNPRIGYEAATYTEQFNGYLDDFEIYEGTVLDGTIVPDAEIFADPTASYTANVTSGSALSLPVLLTNTSTGNIAASNISWFATNTSNSSAEYLLGYGATQTYSFPPGDWHIRQFVTNQYGGSNATGFVNVTTPTVVASFTTNTTSGYVTLPVQFTDTSTGSPDIWYWDFGDGNTSTSQNPLHQYAVVGTFDVKLNATNAAGNYSWSNQTGLIHVYAATAPVASFTSNATSGNYPLFIQFNETSTEHVESRNWSFGDGTYSSDQNATHKYLSSGAFTVNLTATNAYGSNTSTQTHYITVNTYGTRGDPNLTLYAPGNATPFADYSPLANALTSTGATLDTTNYKFGGGSIGLSGSGTYLSTAVKDNFKFLSNVNSSPYKWSIAFWYRSTSFSSTQMLFDNCGGSSANVGIYGGITTDRVLHVNINRGSSGDQICALATSEVPNDNNWHYVVISYDNTAASNNMLAYLDGSQIGTANKTALEPATSSPMYNFTMGSIATAGNSLVGDLDDFVVFNGTIISGTYVPTTEFLTTGSPEVTTPVANFTANASSGYVPLSVQFTDTSTGSPTSWLWDLGDGNTSTSQNPAHTYLTAGIYNVSLTATNDGGSNSTTKLKYIVIPTIGRNLTKIQNYATFGNWSGGDAGVMNNTIFLVAGTDNSTNYLPKTYSSPNGAAWTLTNASAISPGRHANIVTVFNNKIWTVGGYDGTGYDSDIWYSSDGTIWYKSSGSLPYAMVRPALLTYDNKMWLIGGDSQSNGVLKTVYSSTDGITWTLVTSSPPWTQRYAHGGVVYNNKMWIWGGVSSESTSTALRDVWYSTDGSNWTEATADAGFGRYAAKMTVADGLMWTFGGSSGNIAPYTYYGDMHYSADGIAWYNVTYLTDSPGANAENAFVTLDGNLYIIGGGNYSDSGSNDVWSTTTIGAPVANFTYTPTSGMSPLNVSFSDTSLTNITAWNWTFGAANYSSLQNPSYEFVGAGNYSVILSVTNASGTDSITKYVLVTATPLPVADFSGTPTSGTVPLNVTFTDLTTNTPTEWYWDFGDGNTSTNQNPYHIYSAVGSYDVHLNATNAYGSSWANKTGYITASNPPAPTAAFTTNVSTGAAPLSVQFTDASTGSPTSWYWDFGDGNTSTLQNPEHTFWSIASYPVNLTATNAYGSTSIVHTISATSGVSGFNRQDLYMSPEYVLTLTIKDTDGNVIPVVTVSDSDGNVANTTNGVYIHTYPYEAVAIYLSSDGYQSRSITYVMNRDRVETVQMTAVTTQSQNTNIIYTQHQVRLRVLDLWANPLKGVTVTASYVNSTLPGNNATFLEQAFGVSASVAETMMDSGVAMQGITATDGSQVFTMFPSLTYSISMVNSTAGVSCQKSLAPEDSDYILYCPTSSQSLEYNTTATQLADSYVWLTEPNNSYVTINYQYQDPLGLTTDLFMNLTCKDNGTVFWSHDYGNPGTSLIEFNYTIPNVRGMTIQYGMYPVRSG